MLLRLTRVRTTTVVCWNVVDDDASGGDVVQHVVLHRRVLGQMFFRMVDQLLHTMSSCSSCCPRSPISPSFARLCCY